MLSLSQTNFISFITNRYIFFHTWKSLTRARFIELTIDDDRISQSVKVARARWPRQVTKSRFETLAAVADTHLCSGVRTFGDRCGTSERIFLRLFSPSVFIRTCWICSQRCSQSCPTHRSCTTTDKCCWSVPNS